MVVYVYDSIEIVGSAVEVHVHCSIAG